MFRKRKKPSDEEFNIENEEINFDKPASSDNDYDDYEEDEFVEFVEFEDAKSKKKSEQEKKKEFYVSKDELISEIRKYNESKKTDPTRKGKDV